MTVVDPTNAVRKRRMRQKRKEEGMKEVRLWLPPLSLLQLSYLTAGYDLGVQETLLIAIEKTYKEVSSANYRRGVY